MFVNKSASLRPSKTQQQQQNETVVSDGSVRSEAAAKIKRSGQVLPPEDASAQETLAPHEQTALQIAVSIEGKLHISLEGA